MHHTHVCTLTHTHTNTYTHVQSLSAHLFAGESEAGGDKGGGAEDA